MLLNSANQPCIPDHLTIKANLIDPNEQLLKVEKLFQEIIKVHKVKKSKVA